MVVVDGGDGGMEPTASIIVVDNGDGDHRQLKWQSIAAVFRRQWSSLTEVAVGWSQWDGADCCC